MQQSELNPRVHGVIRFACRTQNYEVNNVRYVWRFRPNTRIQGGLPHGGLLIRALDWIVFSVEDYIEYPQATHFWENTEWIGKPEYDPMASIRRPISGRPLLEPRLHEIY